MWSHPMEEGIRAPREAGQGRAEKKRRDRADHPASKFLHSQFSSARTEMKMILHLPQGRRKIGWSRRTRGGSRLHMRERRERDGGEKRDRCQNKGANDIPSRAALARSRQHFRTYGCHVIDRNNELVNFKLLQVVTLCALVDHLHLNENTQLKSDE